MKKSRRMPIRRRNKLPDKLRETRFKPRVSISVGQLRYQAELKGIKGRDFGTGMIKERGVNKLRGRNKIFMTTGLQGGISTNPGTAFAWSIRRRMKPLNIKPAIVRNAAGDVIAEIRTDPVTGKRTRVEMS